MSDDLERFDLLRELGVEDRQALRSFLTEQRLEPGSVLFQGREEADEMFFIVEGTLRIESDARVLGQLGPGDVLGVVSLIQISRRECDAIAQDACGLLVLSREGYLRLSADLPMVALRLQEGILRSFAGQVRSALADRREANPA